MANDKTTAVQVLLPEWADEMIAKFQRIKTLRGEKYMKKPNVILFFLERYREDFEAYLEKEVIEYTHDQILGKAKE